MTKEEWRKIEDWWGTGLSTIKMKIDGHDILLYNSIDKDKMIVEVVIYVDGYIKGDCSTVGNEIGDRFWNRVKKPMYSPKELKERAKLWGKRSKEAQQTYFEYNTPFWRSFKSFKKHITDHNADISLVVNTFNADGSEA